MPYMVFSQYTGDTSNMEADFELPRRKLTALGACRVSGSLALTGEAAGSFTVGSVWDTADAYFDARPQVLGDPEIRALMQARGMAPVQTAFTEVYGQSGNPEGKYAVSVVAAVASQSPMRGNRSCRLPATSCWPTASTGCASLERSQLASKAVSMSRSPTRTHSTATWRRRQQQQPTLTLSQR